MSADHRAEIAARGTLVMEAAVGDEESLPMAGLAIDDARQIDPRLGDKPAAEFHCEAAVLAHRLARAERFAECIYNGRGIDSRIADRKSTRMNSSHYCAPRI